MRVLICDDEESFLRDLKTHVKEYMDSHFIQCWIDAETDPMAIAKNSQKYDIAFLDIQMEEMDGLELAKELKNRNKKTALFFVTNYSQYSDDAFDLHAFRFFQKPFNVVRLYNSLDKAMEYINTIYINVFLKNEGIVRRIPVNDILYVKRENRKVFVALKEKIIQVSDAFDDLVEGLPMIYFYRIHHSFYVNLHHVIQYEYRELKLINGETLSIAPRRQASFHKFWYNYLKKH